jgi:hypothetical protein
LLAQTARLYQICMQPLPVNYLAPPPGKAVRRQADATETAGSRRSSLAFGDGLGELLRRTFYQDWHSHMNDKVLDTLTGMYFTMDDGDGSYAAGQVIRLATEGAYLVRFEGSEVTLPLELVTVGEMLQTTEDDSKLWHFFDTIEERNQWTDWLDTPSKPRVISLVKPAK